MSLLELRGVGKRFGGLAALEDVSFDVQAGTTTAVIGPNGAGKSTCFNVISGYYPASTGRLFFGGAEITGTPMHAIARAGLTRTFQTTSLFARHPVLDNVMVGYRMHTRSGLFDALFNSSRERREEREARERAFEALRFTGIERYAARSAASIPQEAQKRLAIALAVVSKPKLILLDEPVAGLTSEEIGEHADLIRRITASGTTVCLVEHKMDLVMGLADEIVVLHHGRKIAHGTPAQVRADPAVIDAYLGAALDA